MILEVELEMAVLDRPVVLYLPACNSVLLVVAPFNIQHLPGNEHFGHAQSSEGEPVTPSIRQLAIELASDNPRCVAHRLLEANRGCTPIVRSYVDVEPRETDARPVVHGDRAKERGKVLHAVRGHREKDDVANDPEDVCQQQKLWPTVSPERHF
jgi:hypothetical protein